MADADADPDGPPPSPSPGPALVQLDTVIRLFLALTVVAAAIVAVLAVGLAR